MNTFLKSNNELQGECNDVQKVEAIFQTDKGSEGCTNETATSKTSNKGIVSGDIVISTNGDKEFSVLTSGMLWVQNQRVKVHESQVFVYKLDEQLKSY